MKSVSQIQKQLIKKFKDTKQEIVFHTPETMRDKLISFMSKHIGFENAATRREIFTAIWGDPDNYSQLQIWYLWQMKTTTVMRFCRQNVETTFCFIVSQSDTELNTRLYWVLQDNADKDIYHNMMDNQIHRCKTMKKKATQAYTEQLWKKLLNKR